MKKGILLICVLILNTSCKKENSKKEYFIISKQDSINKSFKNDCNTNKLPPPSPQDLKWYSNVVIVLDSIDKVYLYQTESKTKYKNYSSEELIYKFDNPNYIGLKPEYLIQFDSKDFIKFVKTNKDIFGLNSDNENNTFRFFYFASNCDTIKNEAVYEFEKIFTNERRFNYIIRKTTEEENVVLNYKKNNKFFSAEKIDWSPNFLNGKVKPFTKEYEKQEMKTREIRFARETFGKIGMEMKVYM